MNNIIYRNTRPCFYETWRDIHFGSLKSKVDAVYSPHLKEIQQFLMGNAIELKRNDGFPTNYKEEFSDGNKILYWRSDFLHDNAFFAFRTNYAPAKEPGIDYPKHLLTIVANSKEVLERNVDTFNLSLTEKVNLRG